MGMLRFQRVYTAMLDIQVMLLDDYIRQDLPFRIDNRSARVIGGRFER